MTDTSLNSLPITAFLSISPSPSFPLSPFSFCPPFFSVQSVSWRKGSFVWILLFALWWWCSTCYSFPCMFLMVNYSATDHDSWIYFYDWTSSRALWSPFWVPGFSLLNWGNLKLCDALERMQGFTLSPDYYMTLGK